MVYCNDKQKTPVGLILTRQNLPLLEGTGKDALKGGYILKREENDLQIILLSSGSEVELVYNAGKELEEKGIGARVVSMPSWELFESQSDQYKKEVLPLSITKRLAVEAASPFGWERYTGLEGKIIALDRFGASAPAGELFEEFGFSVSNVVKEALRLID